MELIKAIFISLVAMILTGVVIVSIYYLAIAIIPLIVVLIIGGFTFILAKE